MIRPFVCCAPPAGRCGSPVILVVLCDLPGDVRGVRSVARLEDHGRWPVVDPFMVGLETDGRAVRRDVLTRPAAPRAAGLLRVGLPDVAPIVLPLLRLRHGHSLSDDSVMMFLILIRDGASRHGP